MKKSLLASLFTVAGVLDVFAQGQINGSQPLALLALAQTIVNKLSPILVTVALLAFFWFLIQFIWKGGQSPEAHQSGMKGMGYSILALFVMVSIWGIITMMQNILGVNTTTTQPDVPTLPPTMRNQ